jgi:FAD/FMN-containing dehydrogenase
VGAVGTDYDEARRAWNLHADQRPAAVGVATSVEHVQAAVAHARSHHLTLAVQTAGHLGAALPPLDRTLLLKLRLAGEVSVDPVDPDGLLVAPHLPA